MSDGDFSARVLQWFDRHGRHDLPWQVDPTPYRVWVAEIMLQQTRVETVKAYYQRFMARLPDARSLAEAQQDEVLHLWSGLGYYARARNLHRAARQIATEHGGRLPEDLDQLQCLPGIGRSTAGAILALSCDRRHPILDGNAKRVLARYRTVPGWPGSPAVARELWALAERLTPQRRVAAYTQAMMDLGATVCTRTQPRCGTCPLRHGCLAHRGDAVARYPTARPQRRRPVRSARMLMIVDAVGQALLQRRPATGVWGGLWGFPECPPGTEPSRWARECLGMAVRDAREWTCLRHSFTHFHLDITPVQLRLIEVLPVAVDAADRLWYNPCRPEAVGLAAPVTRLLGALQRHSGGDDDGPNG